MGDSAGSCIMVGLFVSMNVPSVVHGPCASTSWHSILYGIAGLAGNSQLGAGAQIKLKPRVSAGLRDGVKVANGHEFSPAVGYCGERMAHDGIANRPCQSVGRTENASASP